MRTTIILALAFSLGTPPLFAQNVRPAPGDRIRVQRTGESFTRVFKVNGVIADTLVLDGGNEQTPQPTRMVLGSIARLQVSNGRRSSGARALRGAAKGLGGGALLGGVIGFASGDDSPGWFSMTAEDKALVGGILMGGAGLLVGTVVGLASNGEQWKSVPLNHISMSPAAGGGLAVSYSHRF